MINLIDAKDTQCKFFLETSNNPKSSTSKVCGQLVAQPHGVWVYASYCKTHLKLVVSTPSKPKTELSTNVDPTSSLDGSNVK